MYKKLETIVQALQEKFNTKYEEFRGEVHMFMSADISRPANPPSSNAHTNHQIETIGSLLQ